MLFESCFFCFLTSIITCDNLIGITDYKIPGIGSGGHIGCELYYKHRPGLSTMFASDKLWIWLS